jgi:uncharacterized RDD family membrane protein YckC
MSAALDTMRRVETPEGVELTMRVAGPVARFLAWVIDFGIRLVFYFLASFLLVLGDLGQGLLFLLLFVVEWFYPVFFEVLWHGRTPGKAALGLVVVNDDGTPVGWTTSIVRNFNRFADFLPFLYLIGLVTMILHPDFKRLGDIAAGTVVAYRERPATAARLPEGAAVPLPAPLDLEEQRAVIDFAERSVGWSRDRNEELAEIAAPLVGGPPPAGVDRLRGMALWLLGQR